VTSCSASRKTKSPYKLTIPASAIVCLNINVLHLHPQVPCRVRFSSKMSYNLTVAEAARRASLIISMMALFTSIATGFPRPERNITITVPDGASNHGNPELLCTPIRWYEVALFFLGNYIAHAATMRPYPGESTAEMLSSMIFALLFPPSGALRGLDAIARRAIMIKKSPAKGSKSWCAVYGYEEFRLETPHWGKD
jgi:hypothetical protein